MTSALSDKVKALRGEMLRAIYRDAQRRDEVAMTHVALTSFLRRIGYKVSRNQVKDELDDFHERGWVTFEKQENLDDGYELYSEIRIAAAGRDVVRGLKKDDTVQVE